MGDYVGDPYPYAKFITIRLPPLAPQICKNAHQVTLLVFWFFLPPTAKTPAPIFMISTSNDVVSHKDVHFVGRENKILHFDPIFSLKRQFLTGQKICVKALTMGMLICKLPLIVIV